jgi:hypothetical protein
MPSNLWRTTSTVMGSRVRVVLSNAMGRSVSRG